MVFHKALLLAYVVHNIYINGLLNIIADAEIIWYADDIAILIHSSYVESSYLYKSKQCY